MTKGEQLFFGIRWNLFATTLAVFWAIPTWFAGKVDRPLGVVSAAGFLILWVVIWKLFSRKAFAGAADFEREFSRRREIGLLVMGIGLGALYIACTIFAASRGFTPVIADLALPVTATALALPMREHKRDLWFAGLAVGILCSVFWFHRLLPENPTLAGLDTPLEGAELRISWHPGGMNAWLVDTLDPPVEFENNQVKKWNVEQWWQAGIDADKEVIKNFDQGGRSCLDLQEEWGEERLVEVLSWMKPEEKKSLSSRCPAARWSRINEKLKIRMTARGEESAALEALASGNLDGAIARARLALEIYEKADFGRAVLAGQLLRRGVTGMRTGKSEQAKNDLEEALLYLEGPSERARAFYALGLVLHSAGESKGAQEAFRKAVEAEPDHPAGKAADSRRQK